MVFKNLVQRSLQLAMPEFLGIGAARAGTSWLWENLRKHSDIWTPKTKEIHFFDRRIENRYLRFIPYDLGAKITYSSFFLKGHILGKMTGEITPAYAILPTEKICLIHSWIPEAKILFIMRDPVSRTWSHAKKDFSRLTGKPINMASEEDLIEFSKFPEVEKRNDYLTCLKSWMEFFDMKNFFITFTEEISAEPVNVLKHIFRFLGVNPDVELNWDDVCKPVHVGLNVAMPHRVRTYLASHLYRQNDRLESLIGRKVPWKC